MKSTAAFAFVFALTVQGVAGQLAVFSNLAGGRYMGSAVDNIEVHPLTNDKDYSKRLGNILDFNQITPSNSMKWESIEPQRGQFNFTGGDEIVAFAKKHGQKVRGHTCAWHSQLAPWVAAGNFSGTELNQILWDHCYTMVKHYKGDVFHWDAVNEAFNEDGTLRQSLWWQATGAKYLDTAFLSAHAADPKAKLYYNDYNIEGVNAKSDGVAALVKDLKKRKIPIHGVGLQAHLILGNIPTTIQENIQRFADLGVDVAITELDIRMNLPVTPEKLAQQKKEYAQVIGACKAVKRCVGVTVWDYTDKYSWIPKYFAGEGAALPWDENYNKKPAYYGIIDGWLSRK